MQNALRELQKRGVEWRVFGLDLLPIASNISCPINPFPIFFKCLRIRLKFVRFYDLSVCKKKAEILPLTTALITHLRSLFNHAIALACHVLKALFFFTKTGLKFSYFGKKMQNFLELLGTSPSEP